MKTGKKFTSMLLVFSLLGLSGSLLFAANKRGAELIILKKDGQETKGELIAVKQNSLLLLNYERKDVSVDVSDIKVVIIVKNSKALLGAGFGLFLGGAIGSLYGTTTETYDSDLRPLAFIVYGVGGALLGALLGGIGGVLAGKDKIIYLEGKSELEIKKALKELRFKARITDLK